MHARQACSWYWQGALHVSKPNSQTALHACACCTIRVSITCERHAWGLRLCALHNCACACAVCAHVCMLMGVCARGRSPSRCARASQAVPSHLQRNTERSPHIITQDATANCQRHVVGMHVHNAMQSAAHQRDAISTVTWHAVRGRPGPQARNIISLHTRHFCRRNHLDATP